MPMFTANRLAGHTIVFDLDGTLVDTAPDLIGCIDASLATRGLPPAPTDVIKPLISIGSKAMLQRAFAHHNVTLPEDALHALWLEYLQLYAANVATRSRPFAGVPSLLLWLQETGATLAVCTNKNEALSKALLGALRLDGFFSCIAGRDTFSERKPHPGHLLKTIAAAGGDPRRATMVGDSDVDIATAKAAGIPIIAVTFGYTPAPVATFGPDATIDAYTEFRGALAGLLKS